MDLLSHFSLHFVIEDLNLIELLTKSSYDLFFDTQESRKYLNFLISPIFVNIHSYQLNILDILYYLKQMIWIFSFQKMFHYILKDT